MAIGGNIALAKSLCHTSIPSLTMQATDYIQSTRIRLTEDIRDAIGQGEWQPGARLSERELCERYGVSRTVVREALRQLEAEGFVTIEAHRGAVVTQISYERAESLFQIRGALESLACRLCAQHASTAQKQTLVSAVSEIERVMLSQNLEVILRAKNAFYQALMDGAGNADLSAMLSLLHTRIDQLRRYSLSAENRLPKSVQELKSICNAIVAGDAEGAGIAGSYHVAQASYAALPRIFGEQHIKASS